MPVSGNYFTQYEMWAVLTFENVVALEIEFVVVRIVFPCSLVDAYNCFRQNRCCLVTVGLSETL